MQASARLIYGALVADAGLAGAALDLRAGPLAEIAARGDVVFLRPDQANYEGCKGTFAHHGKRAGDLSGYGEYCVLMLRHLAERDGRFSRVAYQTLFRKHFGPGGAYVGHVDRPTRVDHSETAAVRRPGELPAALGVKDDRLPALATLPAVVACAHNAGRDRDALLDEIEHVVRVTSDEAAAVQAARVAGAMLFELLAHTSLEGALQCGIEQADGALAGRLLAALSEPTFDAVAAAERFGAACHVEQGLPVIFHILANCLRYPEAVRANILAGETPAVAASSSAPRWGGGCGADVLGGEAACARPVQSLDRRTGAG